MYVLCMYVCVYVRTYECMYVRLPTDLSNKIPYAFQFSSPFLPSILSYKSRCISSVLHFTNAKTKHIPDSTDFRLTPNALRWRRLH